MKSTAEETSAKEARSSPFPHTLWTVVLAAGRGDEEKSRQALDRLCVLYREPIRTWLARTGRKPDDVEDLTQGFIEHLLERNRLKNVEPRATKFRTWLIECLKRFVRGEWRKQTAAKRGGGAEAVDLADVQIGTAPKLDKLLDLDFARTVHQRAIARLQTGEFAAEPKRSRFAELRHFIWGNDETVSYAEAGQRLNMTANHVKKAVFDLRRCYYHSFREEVIHTVTPKLADEETRYLMMLVAGQGGAA